MIFKIAYHLINIRMYIHLAPPAEFDIRYVLSFLDHKHVCRRLFHGVASGVNIEEYRN